MIIAGGGIGGLAAALALARKGFRSVVLEQAPQRGVPDAATGTRFLVLHEGHSVIGGFVYRGKALPQFAGKYIFGDWSKYWIKADAVLFVGTRATRARIRGCRPSQTYRLKIVATRMAVARMSRDGMRRMPGRMGLGDVIGGQV